MNGLMNGYVAVLNVIAALALVAFAVFAWIKMPSVLALPISIGCAVFLPMPIYAAVINFQSYAELRRIHR